MGDWPSSIQLLPLPSPILLLVPISHLNSCFSTLSGPYPASSGMWASWHCPSSTISRSMSWGRRWSKHKWEACAWVLNLLPVCAWSHPFYPSPWRQYDQVSHFTDEEAEAQNLKSLGHEAQGHTGWTESQTEGLPSPLLVLPSDALVEWKQCQAKC